MYTVFNKRSVRTVILVALALAPSAADAASGLVCPVTKLPVASPKVAVGKSVYKGKTYYFCTSNCKSLFDRNPAKYAKQTK